MIINSKQNIWFKMQSFQILEKIELFVLQYSLLVFFINMGTGLVIQDEIACIYLQ